MNKTINILVLCTRNSCRSIMAEALINSLGKERYHAKSAGSNPIGHIHVKTIETLQRHEINPGQPRSKSWNELSLQVFDVVVAICDEVSNKIWPVFPRNPKKVYWHIPNDPAQATGSDAEISAAFDKVFLTIKERVEELIALPK